MAKKHSHSDLITGAFAVVVIIAFIGIITYLQAIGPKVEGTRYVIVFDDVGGVTSNTPVYVAGQRVGKVDRIETLPVTDAEGRRKVEVEVTVIIDESFDYIRVPVDTVARVQMGGLFGGNQIVLSLGSERELVEPGRKLPMGGMAPVTIDTLLIGLEGTVKRVNEGLENVARILNDDDFFANIEGSMMSLRSTLTQLDTNLTELEPAFRNVGPAIDSANALITDLRLLVDENSRAINTMIGNLERASGRIDGLLADEDGVPQLVSGLNSIAGNLDVLIDSLNDLVLDNQLNIQISLENVRETTESLRVFARRIERDPSLLIWGGKEEERAARPTGDGIPHVDELGIRNSGRRPRRESD
jgi:ABC-type transporter Mla subunit MlaD